MHPLRRYELHPFHGYRAGWATHGAQAATDATGFFLDDGRMLAALRHAPVARQERRLQQLIAAQIDDIHQTQAVFGAHVGAAAAQDALVAVEYRTDVAFQAALGLHDRDRFAIILFHLGDADAPVQRQHRRRTARYFFVIWRHPV